jgi:hypothetical protein
MDSRMRVVMALLGVLIGAALSGSSAIVGAILGGFIGYATAELTLLRAMVGKLEQEVARLKRRPADDLAPAPDAPLAKPETSAPPSCCATWQSTRTCRSRCA